MSIVLKAIGNRLLHTSGISKTQELVMEKDPDVWSVEFVPP